MESLHISFKRVVDAGMFNGIVLNSVMHLSHMFYADDAVFMGQWSTKNIDTIIYVLKCFHRASGLSINLSKSKLLGVVVSEDRVVQAANRIGCGVLKAPFAYLGSKVGGNMSRIKSWDEIVDKMVPMKVLQRMESIRSQFFSGVDLNSKKSIWVKWSKVLCSKEKGGLGVSSLLRFNRLLYGKMLADSRLYDVAAKPVIRNELYMVFSSCSYEAEWVHDQLTDLSLTWKVMFYGVRLDRWYWTLDGSGEFSGSFGRKVIDDILGFRRSATQNSLDIKRSAIKLINFMRGMG
ncbi:hypothetical protein Tco_1057875 [Tanacetum coccineum]|uniref:RNA-directed DNA polymerase, eukaryota, reverse transcriptase zinc-binding domain protein n=1 Tax=Tanacetum coccineum TaxID=301880 RepID=A0ABQ5H740_9ASTR